MTAYTITIKGPQGTDLSRMAKVLRHLFADQSNWDQPIPEVEITVVEKLTMRDLNALEAMGKGE